MEDLDLIDPNSPKSLDLADIIHRALSCFEVGIPDALQATRILGGLALSHMYPGNAERIMAEDLESAKGVVDAAIKAKSASPSPRVMVMAALIILESQVILLRKVEERPPVS